MSIPTDVLLTVALIEALVIFCLICVCESMSEQLEEMRETNRIMRKYLLRMNPHAHRLGMVVDARKYEASEWVKCNVICVAWKGAVRVRPVGDVDGGWWIRPENAAERLRKTHV